MDLLTLKEAAKVLRQHPETTRRKVHAHEIPSIRVGRRIFIPEKALREWIEARTTGCAA